LYVPVPYVFRYGTNVAVLPISAIKTAVVDMNMSPGLVLANRILNPSRAFCPVKVTRLKTAQNRAKLRGGVKHLIRLVMANRILNPFIQGILPGQGHQAENRAK
jgi:hypothetical protein